MNMKSPIITNGDMPARRTLLHASNKGLDSTLAYVDGVDIDDVFDIFDHPIADVDAISLTGISLSKDGLGWIVDHMDNDSELIIAGCTTLNVDSITDRIKADNLQFKEGVKGDGRVREQ